MDEPSPEVRTPYEEAARGSADVAGVYRFVGVDARRSPTPVSIVAGCRVYVADGTLNLIADGRYRLQLALERHCADRVDPVEVVKEGLYSLRGHRLRFGDKMLPTTTEPAPEVTTGPEDLVRALFPDGRFAALGSVRVDQVSATLADLQTLYFRRDAGRAARPQGVS